MVFHGNREEVSEDHRGWFRGGRGTPETAVEVIVDVEDVEASEETVVDKREDMEWKEVLKL